MRDFENNQMNATKLNSKILDDQYFETPLAPYLYVRAKIANWRRDKKMRLSRKNLKKIATDPFPDHGYRIIGNGTLKFNGLGRAYRYEIDELKSRNLINPNSRNVIILGQPRHYWKIFNDETPDITNTYRIGMWVTEFDEMQKNWEFALNVVNEIWTPSEFSAHAFRASGLPVRVHPHPVKVANLPPLNRTQFSIPEDVFLGIAIMDLGTCPDRKNPFAHIAAWKMAFGNDQKSILLMKIRLGKRTNYVREQLKQMIGDATNIILVEKEFDDTEIHSFQKMADVYLSLHRSEGYGLNIREMLEMGKPVIATGYSGNMTFMTNYENGYAVPYQLTAYKDHTFHYQNYGLHWASVDCKYVADKLREIKSKYQK